MGQAEIVSTMDTHFYQFQMRNVSNNNKLISEFLVIVKAL